MPATFSFHYYGSTITAEPLGTNHIPPLGQTITAHCVPVTKDRKIVAIDVINRGTDVPGGHIEAGETAEQAMHRELLEEASITVEEPVLINVWRLSSKNQRLGLTAKPYLLLYAAKVKEMKDFSPNKEVTQRRLLTHEEFIMQYFGDKKQAKSMAARALAALE